MTTVEDTNSLISVPFPHRVNPRIDDGRQMALDWCRACGITEDTDVTWRRYREADPERIIGYCYPDAHGEDHRLAVDMMCQFVATDDAFESTFWQDPGAGVGYLEAVSEVLHARTPVAPRPSHAPLVRMFIPMWERSCRGMSPAWREHAARSWLDYFWGYLSEATSTDLPMRDYLELRRTVVGTSPCFDMLERAHHYELPERFRTHVLYRRLREAATDLVTLCNDVASVRKDQARDDASNAVLLLARARHLDVADARLRVVEMIHDRARDHHSSRQDVDRVCDLLYIEGKERAHCHRWAREVLEWVGGNLRWQGQIARYYGKARAVLPDAAHLAVLTGCPIGRGA
ncbi:terpene synthase family protein (plasmid) [Streptomyces sp. BI20]|uniref:terpene synthase family protein n=1 Tax=Streptomyces sp. BI20 TaxID=3403460 RepID=UPI003C72766C